MAGVPDILCIGSALWDIIARSTSRVHAGAEMADVPRRELREACRSRGVKAVMPFLLQRIFELTGGRSPSANIAQVRNNATLAAKIAREIGRCRERRA